MNGNQNSSREFEQNVCIAIIDRKKLADGKIASKTDTKKLKEMLIFGLEIQKKQLMENQRILSIMSELEISMYRLAKKQYR